ncbi:hypothetical protein D3C77_732620 [compost metagenome]
MDAIFFFLRHILYIERRSHKFSNTLRLNDNNACTTMATENGATHYHLAFMQPVLSFL